MKFNIKMRKVKSSNFKDLSSKAMMKAHREASEEYKKEFLKKFNDAISRKDLSEDDLSKLDHPYAKRHGSIQTYGSLKDFMVHERTGSFKRSFKINSKGSNQYQSKVNISQTGSVRPYHSYVMYGTKKMLPRNPILGVQKQMENQRRPRRLLIKHINKQIKKSKK